MQTVEDLTNGVEEYAESKGVHLKAHERNINLFSDIDPFDSDVEYIKEGLSKGRPVALLNWFNPKLDDVKWYRGDRGTTSGNFQTHWVTITGITENSATGEVTIDISSWGGTTKLSFNDMYNASGVGADMGLVYFDY